MNILRRWARIGLILAPVLGLLVYAVALGGLWGTQDGLVFPQRVNVLTYTPSPAGQGYKIIGVTAPDGTQLHGVQSPAAHTTPSPTLIMAFAGNAHDVGGMVLWLRKVYPRNTVVIGFNYRGYPSAFHPTQAGTPSQAAVLQDATAATRWAQAQFKPARTWLVGYSLGSSVAAHTALKAPVSGTVLLAPFTSMAAVGTAKYPWLNTWLVNKLLHSPFPTQSWLAQGTSPVVLVGAGDDGLIPPSHLPALAKAAGKRMVLNTTLSGVAHADVLDDPRLPPLLQRVLISRRSP